MKITATPMTSVNTSIAPIPITPTASKTIQTTGEVDPLADETEAAGGAGLTGGTAVDGGDSAGTPWPWGGAICIAGCLRLKCSTARPKQGRCIISHLRGPKNSAREVPRGGCTTPWVCPGGSP